MIGDEISVINVVVAQTKQERERERESKTSQIKQQIKCDECGFKKE